MLHAATITAAELAYLLHLLSAPQVIGLDNQHIRDSPELDKSELRQLGYKQLVEHGWLIREDVGYNLNDHLMLMVAVMAYPEIAMTVMQKTSLGVQCIAYYQAEGHIVEQIRTAEEAYQLTKLKTRGQVVERVVSALDNRREEGAGDRLIVTLTRDELNTVFSLNKAEQTQQLKNLFVAQELSNDLINLWITILTDATVTTALEISTFLDKNVVAISEVFLFGYKDIVLMVTTSKQPSKLDITQLASTTDLANIIEASWQEGEKQRQTTQ